MKSPVAIYLIGAVFALVCIAIGVYYLTPGITHVVVFDDPQGQHVKHALAFFAVALVALLGARFVVNARKSSGTPF
jgi:hypothetical protein